MCECVWVWVCGWVGGEMFVLCRKRPTILITNNMSVPHDTVYVYYIPCSRRSPKKSPFRTHLLRYPIFTGSQSVPTPARFFSFSFNLRFVLLLPQLIVESCWASR